MFLDIQINTIFTYCCRMGASTSKSVLSSNNNFKINFKIAVKYKVNDFALWINGFEVYTDINGALPIGLIDLQFDRGRW